MAVPTTPSWPKIIDRLTPAGKVDPAADHQQGPAALLPLLAKVGCADGLGHGLGDTITSITILFDDVE
jgi:hypothetical protein